MDLRTTLLRTAVVCASLTSPLALGLEPGARLDATAILPLSEPQKTYFGVGPQFALTGEFEVLPFLDVEAAGSFLLLPATPAAPFTQAGTAVGLSAGVRLKRPLEDKQVLPWASLQLGWSLSGISSLALLPAAGVHFRASPDSPLLFGPVIRMTQLFKAGEMPSRETFNASLLSFGLAVEFAPREAAVLDTDGDGVPDDKDECPKQAGKDANGCPEKAPPPPLVSADQDGDGIPDSADRCATAAEDKDGYQDEDGCPDPDNDGDGVMDGEDLCKNEKGSATAQGCPDQDGDGVPDKVDACPRKPGKKEDGGCPTYKEVVVTATKIEIKQKIFFAFGTTTIMPKSHPLLSEVTKALQDRENICVRVEGHTDSVGNADANLKLSQGRTQAVRDYLVSQGVKTDRLTAKGYGSMLPMDTNGTAEGRENNRRVEFVIVPCEGAR